MGFVKLPSEYVAMLEEHREKLQVVEDHLYEQWKATGEKETVDLCLQAQQQLRLTAQELLKQSPVRSERKEPVKLNNFPEIDGLIVKLGKRLASHSDF